MVEVLDASLATDIDLRLVPPSILDQRTVGVMAVLDGLEALPVSIVGDLYNPDTCLESVLPILAIQFGVLDGAWILATTVAEKRELVKVALALQSKRGTPWALKRALAAVGWPGLVIQERTSHWSKFKLSQPLGGRPFTPSALVALMPIIEAWKPARCVLESIEFGVAFQSAVIGTGPHYDGAFVHDATIKYEGLTLANIAYVKLGAGAPVVQINAPTVVDQGASILVTFMVDADTANGLEIDTWAIFSAADTEITRATAPAVTKTSLITLSVAWTINKI